MNNNYHTKVFKNLILEEVLKLSCKFLENILLLNYFLK